MNEKEKAAKRKLGALINDRELGAMMDKEAALAAGLRRIASGDVTADWDAVRTLLVGLSTDELILNAAWLTFQWRDCETKLRKKQGELAWIVQTREGLRHRFRQIGAKKSSDASHAANIRHRGARENAEKIRQIWASGKYTSKTRCAEEECGALNMSLETARKALRNQAPNAPLSSPSKTVRRKG